MSQEHPTRPRGPREQATPQPHPDPQRAEELAQRLRQMSQTVQSLAAQTPADVRDPGQPVRLLPVTKFFPASDVAALWEAGVRAVGENREQEASRKAAELAPLTGSGLRWEHIGQLQTNKAKSAVRWAGSVHSVDRLGLVQALGRAWSLAVSRWEAEEGPAPRAHAEGGLECFIQVGLSAASAPGQAASGARGGADPAEVPRLAEAIAAAPGLRLAGLMAVAPQGEDPAAAFARLRELSAALRRDHPAAVEISAGMSADLADAIRWGSTRVRVGSAIMGPRPRG